MVVAARAGSGQKLLLTFPSLPESPRPPEQALPPRPRELTPSTHLQRDGRPRRPLPASHPQALALGCRPHHGLARGRARLCQGKMRMCSSRREGGFNQASCWLACSGPSKRLTGGGRGNPGPVPTACQATRTSSPGPLLAAQTAAPRAGSRGRVAGTASPRLALSALFVNVADPREPGTSRTLSPGLGTWVAGATRAARSPRMGAASCL